VLAILIAQSVTILLLIALVVWVLWAQEKQILRLVEGYTAEIRSLQDQMVHYLTTAQREGYKFQPQDEAFESYRITPEMEADLEGRD